MAHDVLERVKLRNSFYRDSYRSLIGMLLVALLAIAVLSGVIAYMVTHRPQPQYFASTDNGRIIPLTPLSAPNLNNAAIRQWAITAAMAVYNYNFINFRQAFNNNEHYFTETGWQAFLKQLESSGNLSAVKSRDLIVSATPTGVPILLNQGVISGRYYWRVQFPLLIQYQSQSENFHENLLITMTITRVSTLKNTSGIGIESFVAQQKTE